VAYPKKLTEDQVAKLMEELKDRSVKIGDLVEKYKVNKTTIYKYLPEDRRRSDWKIDGKTFGRWTVLEIDKDAPRVSGSSRYWCTCSCGVKRSIRRVDLVKGKSTMCSSCLEKEQQGEQSA
jgi:hypothetical protein